MKTIKKTFLIKEVLKESWNIFKNNFWLLLKFGLIMLAIVIISSIVLVALKNSFIPYLVARILFTLVIIIISVLYYSALLGAVDGNPDTVKGLFSKAIPIKKVMKLFLNFIVLDIVIILPIALMFGIYVISDLILVGSLHYNPLYNSGLENPIFIISGFITIALICFLLIKMQYSAISIVDKDLSVTKAIQHSWNITKNNFWKLFLLEFIGLGIILCSLVLFIGILPAALWVAVIGIVVYRKLENINKI